MTSTTIALASAATAYLLVGAYLGVRNVPKALKIAAGIEIESSDPRAARGMRLGMFFGIAVYALELFLAWPIVLLRRRREKKSGERLAQDFSFSFSRPRSPHTSAQQHLAVWELVQEESEVLDSAAAVRALLLVAWKVYSREIRTTGVSHEGAQKAFRELTSRVSELDLSATSVTDMAEAAVARARVDADSAADQVH